MDRFASKASKARQAQSRVKMIEKLSSLQSQIHLDAKADEMRIQLPKPPKPGCIVLTIESLTIGYPQKMLARDISLSLERGMKIAVVGANGMQNTERQFAIFGCALLGLIQAAALWERLEN